jgi:hypothetical protein
MHRGVSWCRRASLACFRQPPIFHRSWRQRKAFAQMRLLEIYLREHAARFHAPSRSRCAALRCHGRSSSKCVPGRGWVVPRCAFPGIFIDEFSPCQASTERSAYFSSASKRFIRSQSSRLRAHRRSHREASSGRCIKWPEPLSPEMKLTIIKGQIRPFLAKEGRFAAHFPHT